MVKNKFSKVVCGIFNTLKFWKGWGKKSLKPNNTKPTTLTSEYNKINDISSTTTDDFNEAQHHNDSKVEKEKN